MRRRQQTFRVTTLPALLTAFAFAVVCTPRATIANARSGAKSQAARPANVKVYRGAINGRGIEMRLAREGARLSGSYAYDRVGQELKVEGSVGADGRFTLAESDAAGRQTGKFACEPGGGDSLALEIDLECEWSKPGGGGKVYAGLTEQHVAFTRGWRVAPTRIENRARGVRVTYPQLAAGAGGPPLSPGAVGFNRRVAALAARVVKEFTAEPRAGRGYLEINYDVLLATDDLISVELAEDNYHGGAHPNVNFHAVNYDLRANRELRLAEVFRPGSDFERALRLHAYKEINRRAAAVSRKDGVGEPPNAGEEVLPSGSEEEITAWALTPRGLLAYFSLPHAVAAFNRNFVPYAAVADSLRPDGPASSFARAR